MIINELTKEQLAICYAHLVYRNTAVEDYHSMMVGLDNLIYDRVYEIVSLNIDRIIKYKQMLIAIKNEDELKKIINDLKIDKDFKKFIADVWFNKLMGCEWDKPQEIIFDKPIKDLTSFILSGSFKECCDKKQKLIDSSMYYINKDICNRIYTLIINDYL